MHKLIHKHRSKGCKAVCEVKCQIQLMSVEARMECNGCLLLACMFGDVSSFGVLAVLTFARLQCLMSSEMMLSDVNLCGFSLDRTAIQYLTTNLRLNTARTLCKLLHTRITAGLNIFGLMNCELDVQTKSSKCKIMIQMSANVTKHAKSTSFMQNCSSTNAIKDYGFMVSLNLLGSIGFITI